jgi:hypothetical protein
LQVIAKDEAWRTAWKGKTHQCIKMLEQDFPGQAITALAIAGGPVLRLGSPRIGGRKGVR